MQRGFTLIELLVVITIIVVLLALLAPALDRAVYQAQLAVCGANLHNIGAGVATYALDFKRSYPYRKLTNGDWGAYNDAISYGTTVSQYNVLGEDLDDRPVFKGYLTGGHMLCPFNVKVDLENSDPDCAVFANYSLFFSVRYHQSTGKSLLRMGDRLNYLSPQVDYTFDVLAADTATLCIDSSYGDVVLSTHPDGPDGGGMLSPLSREDQSDLGVGDSYKSTYARWQFFGNDAHKQVAQDLNVVFQDQSVRRYNGVRWDDPDWAPVPRHTNGSEYLGDGQGIGTYLPLR